MQTYCFKINVNTQPKPFHSTCQNIMLSAISEYFFTSSKIPSGQQLEQWAKLALNEQYFKCNTLFRKQNENKAIMYSLEFSNAAKMNGFMKRNSYYR